MDWDYYEYGREELKKKEEMKGIAKWNNSLIYKSNTDNEKEYNYFEMNLKMEELIDKYGILAKDS